MQNYVDDELASSIDSMLTVIENACDGFYVDPDDPCEFSAIDSDEARYVIIDTAKELCRYICRYAAYFTAYKETLKDCGIDAGKFIDWRKFSELSDKIRKSLEEAGIEITESDAANAAD